MPRRETEPLKRLHTHLFESDYEQLRDLYGDTIGVAAAIRKMVRGALKRMQEKAAIKRREGVQIDSTEVQKILEGAE